MPLHVRNLSLRHIGRTVRSRRRLIFLVIGALAFIAGITLRNIVACICGMLIMGAFASDAVWGAPESAHVYMWQWLNRTPVRRR
jgi:hypothetical protein